MTSTWEALTEKALAHDVDGFMSDVSERLDALVRTSSREQIAALEKDSAFIRLRELSHQDPYTHRGYNKPRGYAGDAVLLDYIYGTAPVPENTSKFGAELLEWSQKKSKAFAAVRERKERLALQMTRLQEGKEEPRCLAVACGHLRELAVTRGSRTGSLSVVALDQDPISLALVDATYGANVKTVRASIRRLIVDGGSQLGEFDLITVAGLYDYLDDASAIALTTRLSARLNVGGRLFIANFIDCWERGYMECFMKWLLIYRTPDQVKALAVGLGNRFNIHAFADDSNTIAYLEIDRLW